MTYEQVKEKLEQFITTNYETETDKEGNEYYLVPKKIEMHVNGEGYELSDTRCDFTLSKSANFLCFRLDGTEHRADVSFAIDCISYMVILWHKIPKQIISRPKYTMNEI